MGWITDRLKDQANEQASAGAQEPGQTSFEILAGRKWNRLVDGLKKDVEEFRHHNADAGFKQLSDVECRVSNPKSNVAAAISLDLSTNAIQYHYEPEEKDTAVPEGGVLSIRPSHRSLELYSADQMLSCEQARRMILEPLLFPPAADPQKTAS